MVNSLEPLQSGQLKNEPDKVSWLLTRTGAFSVKSLYLYLSTSKDKNRFPYKVLWKLKIPSRAKSFCWLVVRNRSLTRDNLKKRGWKGCEKCEFCNELETQEHLFFTCPLARFVSNVVGVALNLKNLPSSFLSLYQQCFAAFSGIDRKVVMIGAVAICWVASMCLLLLWMPLILTLF